MNFYYAVTAALNHEKFEQKFMKMIESYEFYR